MAINLSPPPSPRWYRVAVAFVVAGLVAAVAWWPYATTRIFDAVEAFERTGPYGGPVELAEPGTYTFWVEGTCLSCHDNLPSEYRNAATVAVVSPEGQEIELRDAAPRLYNTARREGRALWLFDITTPGTYRISLAFDTSGDWDNTPPGNVAISHGNGLPVGIVRPMALFAGGGILAGLALAVVTFLRRRRYFDHMAEVAPPPRRAPTTAPPHP
jgi:hypothetical protein